MDDIEADKDLRKGVKIYKNEDRIKHMGKEELDKELEDMQLVDMMEDMKIREPEKEEEANNNEQAEGIDELISKMDKVTIEKD